MTLLCPSYLRRRGANLGEYVCDVIMGDDYGFLPLNQRVLIKARQSVSTQLHGAIAQIVNERAIDCEPMNAPLTNDSLDNQSYLSPVKIQQLLMEQSSSSSDTVSPVYASIHSSPRTNEEEIQPLKSTRRRLCYTLDRSEMSETTQLNTTESLVMNGTMNCTFNMNTSKYLKNSCSAKYRDGYVINNVECVDETTDQCGNLSDVEQHLRGANVFCPANVMMLTVRSHLPGLGNEGQLSITKGVLITGLFMTSNWVCVKLPSGVCGYLPYECVQPVGVRPCKDFTQQFPENTTLDTTTQAKCTPLVLPPKRHLQSTHIRFLANKQLQNSFTDNNSQDGGYVLADSLYEHDYVNNYDVIESNNTTPGEKDRCVLNETIAQSRNLQQKLEQRNNKRSTLYLNNTLTLTPAMVKLSKGETKSTCTTSSSKSSKQTDSQECIINNNNNSNRCYICDKRVHSTGNTQTKTANKYTCAKCVLSLLNNTSVSKDYGYESARSDNGYASNINTYLHESRSNLLESMESINVSEDSGQESDSECSYSLTSSEGIDGSDLRGTCLTVLFDYKQKGSHDLSIKKQEIVTLLYDKHESWFWVRNCDGIEGYVPKNFVVNLEKLNLDPSTKTTYL